jgi:NACalpha-BTF3-like transcription factor
MVIQQTGASHDQATNSLRDAGGDLDAMLLLENSNTLI